MIRELHVGDRIRLKTYQQIKRMKSMQTGRFFISHKIRNTTIIPEMKRSMQISDTVVIIALDSDRILCRFSDGELWAIHEEWIEEIL